MNRDVNIFKHDESDTVGVAVQTIKAGEQGNVLNMNTQEIIEIFIKDDIPLFHKIALNDIPQNSDVIEYGQVIGEATHTISVGEYVHVHNIKTKRW